MANSKTIWRRLYVFVAVALAVFLVSLTSVGFICHGFTLSLGAGDKSAGNNQASDTHPLPIPPEVTAAITAANAQGLAAYRGTQTAVDKFQATQAELQDLLNQHFDQLLHTSKTQTEIAEQRSAAADESAPPSPSNKSTSPMAPPPAAPAEVFPPQMAVNPAWRELKDELDKLQTERTKLGATMLPSHPTLQTLDQSLADLRQRLKAIPPEIPAQELDTAVTNPFVAAAASSPKPTPTSVQPKTAADSPPASAAATAQTFAKLLPGWQTTADQYHDLSTRLQSQQAACYSDINTQSAAWQHKAQIPTDYIATIAVPNPSIPLIGADPRLAIYGCSLLAMFVAALVASGARVSEVVFRTAAEIRQQLAISILGFLPQKFFSGGQLNPTRESRWVRRALLTAELCLAAVVLALALASLTDHHFLTQLLANPLAACSHKFWC